MYVNIYVCMYNNVAMILSEMLPHQLNQLNILLTWKTKIISQRFINMNLLNES